jgi:signal peptidase I
MNYGDLALTYRVSFASLQVGDIVVFHDPRGDPQVVVHRIVSEGMCGDQLCFQTKGDNDFTNPTPDPWNLTAPYYLSKVVLVVPAIGFVSPALWGFHGFSVIFPLSFIALVAFFVAYGRRTERTGTEEKEGEKSG